MSGKTTKTVVLSVVGIALVLFAAFIYINNDLNTGKVRPVAEKESVSTLPVVPGKTAKSDVTAADSDKELDSVFNQNEVVDNFDDLVD
jgi:hypothetical protein